MQIAQLLAMPAGTVITDPVVGTVKAAYQLKNGVGQYGPWTRMDLIVQDQTGEISVSWWEPTVIDPNQVKGAQVSLRAYDTAQSQNVGCSVNQYQRKQDGQLLFNPDLTPTMVHQIKARSQAVTMLSQGAVAAPPPAQATLPGQPAPYQPPAQPYAPPQATSMPAPAPQPVAVAPVSQKLTEDLILERLPKWAGAMDNALPSATIGESEGGRFRSIGAFCSTMAIHLSEGDITLSPVQMPTPAPAPAPQAAPQPAAGDQQDDGIPF